MNLITKTETGAKTAPRLPKLGYKGMRGTLTQHTRTYVYIYEEKNMLYAHFDQPLFQHFPFTFLRQAYWRDVSNPKWIFGAPGMDQSALWGGQH